MSRKNPFNKLWLLIIPVFTAAAGTVSRMLGGGIIELPDLVKEMIYGAIFALPFLIIGYAVHGDILMFWQQAAAVFGIMILTGNMGHGDFFYHWKELRDQTMTPVAIFLYERFIDKPVDRTDWRYDAIGMALVGMAATLPAGIGLMTIGYIWEGVIFGLSGVLKAWAYRDGLKKNYRGYATKGEWRRGLYAGFLIGVLIVWILWKELS